MEQIPFLLTGWNFECPRRIVRRIHWKNFFLKGVAHIFEVYVEITNKIRVNMTFAKETAIGDKRDYMRRRT